MTQDHTEPTCTADDMHAAGLDTVSAEMERDAARADLTAIVTAVATIEPNIHFRQDGVCWPDCPGCRVRAALNGHTGDVWVVPKIEHDESRPVSPWIRRNGWISRDQGLSDPEHTRLYAAQLLAAADEAERRAGGDR